MLEFLYNTKSNAVRATVINDYGSLLKTVTCTLSVVRLQETYKKTVFKYSL